MAIVIANTGKDATLGYLTNKVTVPENLILRLYTNDIIPSEFDTHQDHQALFKATLV